LKNKKVMIIIIISIIVVGTIIFYFFNKNVNKKSEIGDNLSNKTNQEIEEYILNISSYEAELELEVQSNKNSTKYKIKQSYLSPNIEKQVVEEPSNIKGLETIYDGNTLTINNTKLNLTTVYKDYPYLTDNYLTLNSFIQDYKTSKQTKMYEENEIIVMEVILENESPYVKYKKLFIDKKTGKITKMEVQDKNKKNLVYILYKEIKINSLKKDEILAFKIKEISI